MADKSKTIKGATDKELDELLVRLRKENEIQNLIGDLNRKSSPFHIPYDDMRISTEMPIETMYHFGIPGMKWGRRKAGGKTTKTLKTENQSADHKTKMSLKKKKLSQMSNAEVKALNERLQLEKTFKDLNKADTHAGKKFVTDLLIGAGKQTAGVYAAKYMAKGAELLIKAIKIRTGK